MHRTTRRRALIGHGLVALLLLTVAGNHAASSVRGRLRVSSNHRYLQFEDGTPFFYMADTAWELIHRLNREEASRYLEDRARKGFTLIQAVALSELDGLTVPNAYGATPLIGNDPGRPNPDYFAHVDFIVQRAEALGMFVGLLPTWGKYWKAASQGAAFTADKAMISAPRVRESWFDPRYGVLYDMHTTDSSGYQTYQPPSSGRGKDWVLLLEAVK